MGASLLGLARLAVWLVVQSRGRLFRGLVGHLPAQIVPMVERGQTLPASAFALFSEVVASTSREALLHATVVAELAPSESKNEDDPSDET